MCQGSSCPAEKVYGLMAVTVGHRRPVKDIEGQRRVN